MIAFRCSKTAEYYEVPENFTIESWGDLADDLLCAGVNASGIRDALVDVWPDYQWFVFVQDSYQGRDVLGWGESHYATNLRGKFMFVWMYSGSVNNCTENAVSSAQTLIDKAIATSSTPNCVMDFIQTRKYRVFH